MYRRRNKKPEIETHKIKEFKQLVVKYGQGTGIDPFARNCQHAYFTNDINPDTLAKDHMDAFLVSSFNCVLFYFFKFIY